MLSLLLCGLTLLYASAAEGFRDGGINRPVPVPLYSADLAGLGYANSPPSYKADSLWSYELGAKSHALNDAVSLSGAVFDIRWNNIQNDIILPTCTFAPVKFHNRIKELRLRASSSGGEMGP